MHTCKRCGTLMGTKYCRCRLYVVHVPDWGINDAEVYAFDEADAAEKYIEENDNEGLTEEITVIINGRDYIVTGELCRQYTARGDS